MIVNPPAKDSDDCWRSIVEAIPRTKNEQETADGRPVSIVLEKGRPLMALVEHHQPPEVLESEHRVVQRCQVDRVFQVKHSGRGIHASRQLLGQCGLASLVCAQDGYDWIAVSGSAS